MVHNVELSNGVAQVMVSRRSTELLQWLNTGFGGDYNTNSCARFYPYSIEMGLGRLAT